MALLTNAGRSLVRRPDWPARLSALIRARRSQPYVYGKNDCACFAVDAVREITGTDLAPDVHRPTSGTAGARFLLANGVRTIEELFASMLGATFEHVSQARRGDLISFAAADETHMALVTGEPAVTPGPRGLYSVPRVLWRKGWKVG